MRHGLTRGFFKAAALALAVGIAAVGCEDDAAGPDDDEAFTLTFGGDATFQGPHGGQAVSVAVVRGGSVVATQSGTISSDDDPSFSFTFTDALEAGESHEVHYWIDSNFNGGTDGECDDIDTDHQWAVDLGTADDDVQRTESHDAGARSSVCSTFDG